MAQAQLAFKGNERLVYCTSHSKHTNYSLRE